MSKKATANIQSEAILRHLDEEEGLSTLEAREKLGIMSPATRVFELREDGYPITTVNIVEHDITGTPHKVAKYIMQLAPELGE